jgi:hypothetical protein
MNLLKSIFSLFIFIGFVSLNGVAQKNNGEWQLGYFAPYLLNSGGVVGRTFELKKVGGDSNVHNIHSLQLLTQLGYFRHSKVSHNFLFNPELVYRWKKSGKRFFLSSSVGNRIFTFFPKARRDVKFGNRRNRVQIRSIKLFSTEF